MIKESIVSILTALLVYLLQQKNINAVVAFICKYIIDWRKNRRYRLRMNLSAHPIFSEIDNCVKYKIPQVKYPCKLRKELFSSILTTKLIILKNKLIDISKEDISELNKLSKEDLTFKFSTMMMDINTLSKIKWENSGVFDFVIDKYLDETKHTEVIFNTFIARVIMSDAIHSDNIEKIHSIFMSLGILYISLLLDMETTFTKINGGLLDKKFNSITCLGYTACGKCRAKLNDHENKNSHS